MFGLIEELTMPYIKEIVIAGKTIEVSQRYSCRNIDKKIPRSENKNETPKDVKKINERNSETNLRRLINTNFKYQDIHLVLTYKRENRPGTPQEAKRDLERFLRKLRTYYKKHDDELKYIAVTEYENKSIHHHLVINSMDTRDLTELWKHGQPHPTYLERNGQYGKLASYLIKETNKTFNTDNGVHGKRWCASKNLQQPKIIKKIVSANSWKKDPKPKKGYYIEEKRSGYHEATGYPFQFYIMVKLDEGTGKADKGGIDHEMHARTNNKRLLSKMQQ
jgi:hypothetical protein